MFKIILTLLSLTQFPDVLDAQYKIAPLESVTGHYRDLSQFDHRPSAERSALDDIIFPPHENGPGTAFIGQELAYLTQTELQTLIRLVKPPANSSDQTAAEIRYLKDLERARTDQIKNRVMDIAHIGYWPDLDPNSSSPGMNFSHLFWEYTEVFDKAFDNQNRPKTAKLLQGVTRDARIIEFTLKAHFNRARPYHLNSELDVMTKINSPSFPSGHTLWAYVQAFIWSELFPNNRLDFLTVAREVGESREIMGIHYPSDEEAARILAHRMIELMSNNPIFITDIKAAMNEWSQHQQQ